MSIKAGRVGVNPSQVDPVDGSILSSATSGYTKQEADAKFLSQTDAASTYESKSDASAAHNALQPKTLDVPIEMLSGSKLTVESALQGLNDEKMSYADNGVLGAKNRFYTSDIIVGENFITISNDGQSIRVNNTTAGTWRHVAFKVVVEKNTDYIFTTDAVYTSGDGVVGIANVNNETIIETSSFKTNKSVTLAFNSGNNDYVIIKLVCTRAASEVGDIIYNNAMLRLATDPDSTYQPYAMTNRELTEFKIKLDTELLQASSFADFKQRMSN